MVFSSISFIFFILPLFLAADRLASLANARWRNAVLIGISLLFYVWGESTNVVILVFLGLLNYFGGRALPRAEKRKLWAGLLVGANLAVLFVFKYLAWLLNLIPGQEVATKISLPLGISFFTFHAVSYIIDIYRKDVEPAPDLTNFMAYFCMFPHLVAGPIVRYRMVENDLRGREKNSELFHFGLYRFLLGLNKKILIANTVAPLADLAFFSQGVGNTGDAWLGIAAYAIQIYFDFSAYSDMAIGLAAMAGFKFEENFARPYSAVSIRDFWRRWHISLSTWFRDYLYIPLGGSHSGRARTLVNLMAVFFLCGLWHGADITFIVWGLWHGAFLTIERIGLGKILDAAPAFVGRIYTILVVVVGWVFFRAENMGQALHYLTVMFDPAFWGGMSLTGLHKGLAGLALGVLICLCPDRLLPFADSRRPNFSGVWMAAQAVLFFISLAFLLSGSRNPFIYFNF